MITGNVKWEFTGNKKRDANNKRPNIISAPCLAVTSSFLAVSTRRRSAPAYVITEELRLRRQNGRRKQILINS